MSEKEKSKRCLVLVTRGGLDTSLIIPWLKEKYGIQRHRDVGRVGQGETTSDGGFEKAYA